MRIARVLTRLNLGGPARQVLASDPLLAARGHVLRVFAGRPEPGEGDLFEELQDRGVDVVRVERLGRGLAPARDLAARRALARELADFGPDVLHTHASKAGALGRSALERLPGAAAVARVHTFHGHVLEGYFPAPIARRITAHERRLALRTDRIVAVSHATADDLVRLGVVAEERIVVIPPGLELEPLLAIPRGADGERALGPVRRLIGAGTSELLVGVLGRLAEVKQPALALEVFALLAERHPTLQLVFVGDGSERRALERAIGALGARLGERVHLLGARTDVVDVLADLDVLLLTSRAEGLPVALIESAAAGLPVVATDVGGVGEIVAHERTGFLGQNVAELAFHLDAVLSDGALRRGLGARARLRVAARHSARQLADRLEELYRVVVEERACAS